MALLMLVALAAAAAVLVRVLPAMAPPLRSAHAESPAAEAIMLRDPDELDQHAAERARRHR